MDNLTLARKLEKYYRSLGMPVPSDLLSIIDNNGIDIQKDYIQPQITIPKAMGGKSVNPNLYNQDQFNEFNEGGSHESNPNGGVPIGNNSTVEEGETSINTKDGQFIFSDRIDTLGNVLKPLPNQGMAAGGPDDPPTKEEKTLTSDERMSEYKKERDFVRDWFTDPITMNKFVDRRIKEKKSTPDWIQKALVDEDEIRKDTYWDVTRGLSNIEKSSIQEEVKKGDTVKGDYSKRKNEVTIYKSMFDDLPKGTSAHEFSHALGLDKELSKYAQKDVSYLQIKDTDLPNERDFKQYLNRGEIFPRIMGIRYNMGLKPGDTVTTEDIKKFKDSNKDTELFKWYSDEEIRDLLNKSVELMEKNKTIKNETRYT